MSLLVKAAAGREICEITPERAGWTHVGFRALRLAAGDQETITTGARELCLVVLTGTVEVQVGDTVFAGLGSRDSVFAEQSPDALYVPGGQTLTVTASRDSEVALCTAPSKGGKAVRRIDGSTMRRSVRGKGSNTRYVCDILPQDDPSADHLLEETYYHRLNPPQGFAFQRVYTDDRSIDEACAVENHDVVMVPRGYHPCVAPHGYDLYYLNVMAGPGRLWHFKNDPAHEWMVAL